MGDIVPYWIYIVPDLVDNKLTNIVLSLSDDSKKHLLKFKEIEPELLLSLRKLSSVEIHNILDESIKRYCKTKKTELLQLKAQKINEDTN